MLKIICTHRLGALLHKHDTIFPLRKHITKSYDLQVSQDFASNSTDSIANLMAPNLNTIPMSQLDHIAFLKAVPDEQRRRLTETTNAPGVIRVAVQFSTIGLTAYWIGVGLPFWPLALPIQGILLAFLFTLQHECTHRTPFRAAWLNEVIGHLTGFLITQPFEWFRAFHLAHHKHTNDPENDPELAQGKPETRAAIFWHIASVSYWAAKVATLFRNAFGDPDAPYLSERHLPRIRQEARWMLAGYAIAGTSVFFTPLLFWTWLLPLAFGFPVLRLYLLAEHGRCPAVANMFDNTRTTLTNRMVRLLAWNMPYHAEHHAWPTVPFHHLPELHDMTKSHLKRVSDGYVAFTKDYLGR